MLDMKSIRYPKKFGVTNAIEITLHDDLSIGQWIVPKGTIVKTWQTENFGWLILPQDCKDKQGFTIPRRIFSY